MFLEYIDSTINTVVLFHFLSLRFLDLIDCKIEAGLCKTYIIAAYLVIFIDYISSSASDCNKAQQTFHCSSAVFWRLERCYSGVTCQAAGSRYVQMTLLLLLLVREQFLFRQLTQSSFCRTY